MQKIDDFRDNLGTAIGLVGGAGSGKTSLGLTLFPRTYAFIADLNFKSGLDHLRRIGKITNVVGFDTASPDETGKIVAVMSRYDRMFKLLNEAIKSAEVDAVFLDSATFIEDIIKAKICSAANAESIKLNGYEQWGLLLVTWKSFIMQLRQSGKKVILAMHEEKEKDSSDQIFKYKIAVDGKIAAQLPAFLSDVWRCYVKEPATPTGKHEWRVATLSNLRQEHLKNSMGLPGDLLQDELVKLIQAKCTPTTSK